MCDPFWRHVWNVDGTYTQRNVEGTWTERRRNVVGVLLGSEEQSGAIEFVWVPIGYVGICRGGICRSL